MITLFWIVAFCLGWRIITDEGQLLHFIREPFDNIDLDAIKERLKLAERFDNSSVSELKKRYLKHKLMHYLGKPFVLCITCMASIWGTAVFVSLNGFTIHLIPQLIITIVSASFIQTLIWSFYVRYIQ